ncbi:MAG: DEAD/DEAH box helicase [Saprospiraceae bacterium]|nr:DEAD/DEAH box helicase [Saprospiraceae bacterium]
MKFTEFDFETELLDGLTTMGFESATPIQEKAIPEILNGKDVLACAQTGTGKTAAFLLPVLNLIAKNKPEGISTLILGPTRELVVQVEQQLEALSYFTNVSSYAIYGGRSGQEMEFEKRAIKKGVSVIVATPGRLKAHIDLGYVDMSKLKYLILDEADRMLDMGFIPAVMDIVNQVPRERQTLLFSATMPPKIRQLTRQLQKDPVEISIAISKPAENILQSAYHVEDGNKIELTEKVLQYSKKAERILIFASTKKKVRELATALQKRDWNVGAVHSDLEQSEREEQLSQFKSGALPVVVATDVLARGIDISGIDIVINYDVPNDAEDYVHRIGRTARAEASGMALTYINHEERRKFQRIEDLLQIEIRRSPLPQGMTPIEPPKRSSYRNKGNKHGNRKRRPSNRRRNKRN